MNWMLTLDMEYEVEHLPYKHLHDDMIMAVDTNEEDWCRMHDIIITNGQVRLIKLSRSKLLVTPSSLNPNHICPPILEYTGHGLTILDVGFAQARNPLNTTFHYFEIQIIDPGENCYIAIGLTQKDYPKNRHPGWDEGSIAYHADDGKIFIGSGVGEDFGPKCHKGDILGCGISFANYVNSFSDLMSQDKEKYEWSDESSSDYDMKSDEVISSSSKTKSKKRVEVFFTRNGSNLGVRRVEMPESGFYPSVGMLSVNEKVRVNLRPLTG